MARRRDEVIWRPVDGRVVGLDLRSSRYFSLNPSASALWEALEGDADPDELAGVLVDRYGIELSAAVADVDCFLVDLRGLGLLEE
jgi:hypothetical protein